MAETPWQDVARALDDCLPQTQCGQCGYNGCRPYADAMAQGAAPVNRCPPGGQDGVSLLAGVLGVPVIPLDPDYGPTKPRLIASIQGDHCIGCTLCITACPVDAIIGANKKRHAVIASLCTGCELCIPPCPVDCIELTHVPQHSHWTRQQAHAARVRMHSRDLRLQRQKQEHEARLEAKALHKAAHLDTLTHGTADPAEAARKRDVIAAALLRARLRRAGSSTDSAPGIDSDIKPESTPGSSPTEDKTP